MANSGDGGSVAGVAGPPPGDESSGPTRGVKSGTALCLSGGGYRAMVFHLGALIRLNELGRLRHITRVSSVSGGSITNAVLALAWPDLRFDGDGPDAVCTNLDQRVIEPVRRFSERTIDVSSGLKGLFMPKRSVADMVAKEYDEHLFHGATLQDLPADDAGPRVVINATNVGTGKLMRFSKPYMADYRIGQWNEPTIPLADAVAASSAFPPMFSPHVIEPRGRFSSFTPAEGGLTGVYRERLTLTDGGVYDNLGVETTKQYRSIYVSDGGGQMPDEEKPSRVWVPHLQRVLSTVDSQVRALRKREMIRRFEDTSDPCTGALWTIRTADNDELVADRLHFQPKGNTAPEDVPTRLKKLNVNEQEDLINWGYVISDAVIRTRDLVDAPAPTAPPFP